MYKYTVVLHTHEHDPVKMILHIIMYMYVNMDVLFTY